MRPYLVVEGTYRLSVLAGWVAMLDRFEETEDPRDNVGSVLACPASRRPITAAMSEAHQIPHS